MIRASQRLPNPCPEQKTLENTLLQGPGSPKLLVKPKRVTNLDQSRLTPSPPFPPLPPCRKSQAGAQEPGGIKGPAAAKASKQLQPQNRHHEKMPLIVPLVK